MLLTKTCCLSCDQPSRRWAVLVTNYLPSHASDKTNNKNVPLLLLTAIDGNGRTFIALGALLASETVTDFRWIIDKAQVLLGTDACAAVHVIVSDMDAALTKALSEQV